MDRGMFLYPWDMLDEGIDNTVTHLKNMGVTYVSLAVLYHTAKLLLPHNSKHHLYTVDGGTCFYHSQQEQYGRLKPIKSSLLDSYPGDFFKDAAAHFKKAGIKTGVWVVMFHNDYLAKEYPDCALQNCFGERSNTNLCPSNPEVYEYGLKLIKEISELGVDEMHLESVDYAGFLHGDHHEMQAFEDTAALDRLMGTCYCPYCQEGASKAGVDVDRLMLLARQEADDFFHFRKTSSCHTEYERLYQAYLRVKQEQIASFYRDVRDLLEKKELHIKVKPILWLSGDSNPCFGGVDMHWAGGTVDGVIAVYPDTDKSVAEFVGKVRTFVPEHMAVTGGIRLMAGNTTNPRQVKNYIEAYRRCGLDDVIFYNYGMAPLPFLKQLEVN